MDPFDIFELLKGSPFGDRQHKSILQQGICLTSLQGSRPHWLVFYGDKLGVLHGVICLNV